MRIKIFILFLLQTLSYSTFAQVQRNFNVYLRSNTGTITLWDGKTTNIYGMASRLSEEPPLPARTLYANEGDTVVINALNISQGEHHSIHLHGLDVDTRNDGDPATSFWLKHMQDTTYTFVARHAGTYLYHCHVADVVHVQMGMYGLIVVRAKDAKNTAWTGGPAFDKEYKWLTSELDKRWHDTVPVHDPVADTIHLPLYKPHYFLVNGKSHQQIVADDSIHIAGAQNQFIYIRVGNIGFYDNAIVFPPYLNATIIDSDGRPLPGSVRNDTLHISPGERYGVMLNPSMQKEDTIRVYYVNMNTQMAEGMEKIPVNIQGWAAVKNNTLNENNKCIVYPNPASSVLHVKWAAHISTLFIYDSLGKLLKKMTVNELDDITVDLNNWPGGLYFIRSEKDNSGSSFVITR